MLVIRSEQKKIFEEYAFIAFSKQAIEHLRTELPELTTGLSDEALLDSVRLCIPIAASYGLNSWTEVMAFVDASYLLGDERFDLDPDYWWASEILNNSYFNSTEKAIQLLDSAFAENQMLEEE
jgi:hypothetical protein